MSGNYKTLTYLTLPAIFPNFTEQTSNQNFLKIGNIYYILHSIRAQNELKREKTMQYIWSRMYLKFYLFLSVTLKVFSRDLVILNKLFYYNLMGIYVINIMYFFLKNY